MNDIKRAKFLLSHEKIIECFDNGEIEFTCWINNEGEFDGNYKTYYKSGKLSNDINYKMGELDGEFKMWEMNGELSAHLLFKNGDMIKNYDE